MSENALILFGHGSRDPRWAESLIHFQTLLKNDLPTWQIELAFLEFSTPTLEQTLALLTKNRVKQVYLLPMFIGMGNHLRRDLPIMLQTLAETYPELSIQLLPSFGENTPILQAAAMCLSTQLSCLHPSSKSK